MASPYVEGFEPIASPSYVEGFEPISNNVSTSVDATIPATSLPGLKPSTVQTLAERDALEKQFISQSQRPGLQKLIEGSLGLGEALVHPLVSIAKGVGSIPQVANQPETILPTLGESGRRLGMDILNLGRAGGSQLLSLINKGPAAYGLEQIAKLGSRTPSQEEVQQFLSNAPLEEAIQQERQKVAFPGANPELAEAITQTVELVPPIKGVKGLSAEASLAKEAPERILRAAIKPPKQLGARFENAAKETIGDIYHANPNADKLGSMPIEGFQQTVSQVQKVVGSEIDDALKKQNVQITAGDDIAKALNQEADKLEKAGQPAGNVQILRNRANDFNGKVTDIDSLRTSTTLANRELTPAFTRSREAANPIAAQADTIANKIIAKEGGSILNKHIESIQGPDGSKLRKKWSDLTLIENQASDRLNQIINSAPAEIQSTLTSALTSLEGVGGLVGLVQGYAAGAIPLATSAAKAWARRSNKVLKDSNSLISSAYEKLRSNPPQAPAVRTPIPPAPPIIAPIGQAPLTPQQMQAISIAQSSSVPIAAPQVNLQNIIQQRLSELNAATGNQPLVRPNPGSTFSPPSAAETSDFLTRTIQDSLERAAREKAIREAGSTLGFF